MCDSACLVLTCLFLLSCKCETVLGNENFIYKYECRRDKLLVSTHSGKRQETLHSSLDKHHAIDSRRTCCICSQCVLDTITREMQSIMRRARAV